MRIEDTASGMLQLHSAADQGRHGGEGHLVGWTGLGLDRMVRQ
jgi:hypothetical protein